MIDVVKEPHTAIFSGPTRCGKTKRVLDLIQNEYKHYFENIVVLCPTIPLNDTYIECSFLKDDYLFMIDPEGNLFDWIEKFSKLFTGKETLFIIDNMISDKKLNKRRQLLLKLATSGRHRKHSLWLLTQSYTALPKDLRRQKKMLFMWYPHERSDMRLIDEETNLIEDWEEIKTQLKQSKHACLSIRLEHPPSYQILM